MDKQFTIKVRAVIFHKGKLLAVRHKKHDNHLALPGGHLEWAEDVKECLDREMIEELGVKPKIGKLLYVNAFLDKNKHYVEFFFEIINGADYLNNEELVRSHAHEIAEIVWASPADDIDIRPKSFMEDFRAGKIISDEIRFIKD